MIAYRLARAHHDARTQSGDWRARHVDHMYFTYVSLWIGFLIVPALNVPFLHVAVPAVVLTTLALGHTAITRFKAGLPDADPGRAAGASRPSPTE